MLLPKHFIKKTMFFLSVLIILTSTVCGSNFLYSIQKIEAEKKENKRNTVNEILQFQEWVKKILEAKGEKAFPEISKINYDLNENYFLILNSDGTLVKGIYTEGYKNNMMYMKDEHVKYIMNLILNKAKQPNGGWITFKSRKLFQFTEKWKTANVQMVTAPDGKKYITVCGGFDIPGSDLLIKSMVEDFVARNIEIINNDLYFGNITESGEIQNESSFLFIFNINGKMLFNPTYPELENRNFYNFEDCDNKQMFKSMILDTNNTKGNFIDYQWCTNENRLSSTLRVFYKKIVRKNKIDIIVAAGYFK